MDDLTPKQKGFVKDYLDTGNATEAVRRNYNVTTDGSARAIGSENLTKPNIRGYLDDVVENAKATIIALATGADNENVRLKAAQDIVDRVEGKATQHTDVTTGGEPLQISTEIAAKHKLNAKG